MFEASKEEDQDNINVSVFSFKDVFRFFSEDMWGNIKIVIFIAFLRNLILDEISEGFNVAVE